MRISDWSSDVCSSDLSTSASPDTRQKFRTRLRQGEIDDKEIEIEVQDSGGMPLPTMEIPGMPGASMGMLNLGDIFGQAMVGRLKQRRMTVAQTYEVLIDEERAKLLDEAPVVSPASHTVETHGILFLDTIDKTPPRPQLGGHL